MSERVRCWVLVVLPQRIRLVPQRFEDEEPLARLAPTIAGMAVVDTAAPLPEIARALEAAVPALLVEPHDGSVPPPRMWAAQTIDWSMRVPPPVAYDDATELSSNDHRLEALLDELENPAPIPVGAPGSAMRRAWERGVELRSLRRWPTTLRRWAAEIRQEVARHNESGIGQLERADVFDEVARHLEQDDRRNEWVWDPATTRSGDAP